MQWLFVTEYDKVQRELSIRHVSASVSQNSTPIANLYQSIVISGALRGDVPAVSEQRFYNIVDFTAYVVQSPDTTRYRFNTFNDIYVDVKLEAVAENGRRGVILSSINRGGNWVSQSYVYEK